MRIDLAIRMVRANHLGVKAVAAGRLGVMDDAQFLVDLIICPSRNLAPYAYRLSRSPRHQPSAVSTVLLQAVGDEPYRSLPMRPEFVGSGP